MGAGHFHFYHCEYFTLIWVGTCPYQFYTYQDIFNCRTAFLENGDNIFQGLSGLEPYIALSRNFAFFVPSNLTCRKDHLPAFGSR